MATESAAPSAQPRAEWHLREAHELAREHEVDPGVGLHEHQVAQRTRLHGANELPEAPRRSILSLLLEQFSDFMILVLIGAAVISGLIGDVVDTVTILVIIVLNGATGAVQSWRADRALAALRHLAAARATVLRGGEVRHVPAQELVPGDVVLLEAGNQVPADLRLTEIAQLKIDESALTGESASVDKHSAVLREAAHSLGDRLNMAFKGTTVTHGRGRGLVVATGRATEFGKLASLLEQPVDLGTPLQRRLAAFGRRLAIAVLAICVVIFGVGILRGESPMLMVLTALSLAVAAIPEALPAVVTVLLALGARRMVAVHALVRRLPSVETLGSVTYICSDKTGTLTRNRMQVDSLVGPDGSEWMPGSGTPGEGQAELLRALALCNDATPAADGSWRGDSTETALADVAASAGHGKNAVEREYPRVFELPFDSGRKRMTTVHRMCGGYVAYTKGAPETVVPLTEPGADGLSGQDWLDRAEALAARGLRVLAVARRPCEHLPAPGAGADEVECGLSMLGLVGLIDPPRPEAAAAVQECKSAGITPVMITGDHPATAGAIALRLGIVEDAQAPVLTGTQLAALDRAALMERVRRVRVYARVDPAQKIEIVQALQSQGEFVAMTGDGVNDAPALRRADIGVAMGKGGTDVAREASSLVLLDDNFATIVAAVREGRRIYDNIRKFVRYAMTGNSAEIWVIFLAPLLGLPIPLLPIHILWINLLTDGLPGLALAAEPAEPGVMRRAPRPPAESLFAGGLWQHIFAVGLLLAGLCLGLQGWALSGGNAHWQTMVFTALTFGQMAHVLAIRSETEPLWRLGLRSNTPMLGAVLVTFGLQLATIYVPALNPIFKTQPLSAAELALCLAAAMLVWIMVEAEKAWRRTRVRPPLV